jgi:uncharacterized surface protein with fasciclin (FAS1) repeats
MKNNLKHILLLLSPALIGLPLTAQTLAPALADAQQGESGAYGNWFGVFTPLEGDLANEGWVDHGEHGELYLVATGEDLWVYDPNVARLGTDLEGWIYTSREVFPFFLAQLEPELWLQFIPGVTGPAGTPRVFVNSTTFDNLYLSRSTTGTIVDVAVGSEDFESLVAAVTTAELAGALSAEGPLTVFAPTDAAFAALDPDTLNDLLTNPESRGALTDILTYHVVPGRITADMLGLDAIALLNGASLNGFVETLNGADLRVDITPFGLLLNGTSLVTAADVEAANGLIHVIDSVLLPPQDIVDTAISAGFATLVTAVQAAGLEDALRGEGPLTVFAPTEAAFAALGEETLNSLLANPEGLADILLYHVVGAKVYSANVPTGPVETLNGASATIAMDAGNLQIDGANIVTTDIVTANGVIHVIDAVILPPAD